METEEEYLTWSLEKLRRRRDQEWEMAGCARQDRDPADEARHTTLARRYERRIGELR